MLESKEIVSFFEKELNSISQEIVFKIYDNWGDYIVPKLKIYNKDTTCYGVMNVLSSDIVPIEGLESYLIGYSTQFICNVSIADRVYSIFEQYISKTVGTSGIFGDMAYVVNCDMPQRANREMIPYLGDCIEFAFDMSFQFIKGAKLSNSIVLKIDDEIMPILSSNIARLRIGETENLLSNTTEMQTVITQQGLTMSVTVPYMDNSVIKRIAQDIMGGALSTKYKIEYTDGNVNFVANMVLKSGQIPNEAQKPIAITLDFVIAREDLGDGDV